MKYSLTLILFLFFLIKSNCQVINSSKKYKNNTILQNSKGQSSEKIKNDKNSVTVEVFGHSRSLFSVNYERLLKHPSKYLFYTVRSGFGYSPGLNLKSVKHKGTVTLPLVISLLAGKKKHFAQLSAGYSASFGENFIDSTITIPTIYQKFQSAYTISLGYRYMWSGVVAQFFPIFQWTNNESFRFSIGFGLSIGTTF